MESQMTSTSCSLNPKQAQSLFTVLLNLQASCKVCLILTETSPTHAGKKKKKKIRVIFSVTQWKANFSLARQLMPLEIKLQTAHMPRPPVAGSPAQRVTKSSQHGKHMQILEQHRLFPSPAWRERRKRIRPPGAAEPKVWERVNLAASEPEKKGEVRSGKWGNLHPTSESTHLLLAVTGMTCRLHT